MPARFYYTLFPRAVSSPPERDSSRNACAVLLYPISPRRVKSSGRVFEN
jgi:hypothetical protein